VRVIIIIKLFNFKMFCEFIHSLIQKLANNFRKHQILTCFDLWHKSEGIYLVVFAVAIGVANIAEKWTYMLAEIRYQTGLYRSVITLVKCSLSGLVSCGMLPCPSTLRYNMKGRAQGDVYVKTSVRRMYVIPLYHRCGRKN
jgi:hypothetical protein